MLSAKSAHDKERQQLFDKIRHIIGTKHQVPDYLTMYELYIIEELLLSGEIKSETI